MSTNALKDTMKENNTYQGMEDTNNLPESLRVNPFDVPKDYFSNLESTLLSQVKLVSLKDEEIFEVPMGYFDTLSTSVLSQIEDEKKINDIQADGFETPEGYFASLEMHILSRISEDNLRTKFSSDGFNVPENYFETLTDKILSTDHAIPVKRMPLHPFKETKISFARYFAAASVALLLGFGGYWGYSHMTSSEPVDHHADIDAHLAQVPEEEIINYLAASTTGDDMIYLSKYTDEHDIPTNGIANSISEKEIEDYLTYSL